MARIPSIATITVIKAKIDLHNVISLFPYDLVRMKKEEIDKFYYFNTIDIDSNRIIFKEVNVPSESKDHRYSLRGIDLLEKYEISILGEMKIVKNEKRQMFRHKES